MREQGFRGSSGNRAGAETRPDTVISLREAIGLATLAPGRVLLPSRVGNRIAIGDLFATLQSTLHRSFQDPWLNESYRIIYVKKDGSLEIVPGSNDPAILGTNRAEVSPTFELNALDPQGAELFDRQERAVGAVPHSHTRTLRGSPSAVDAARLFESANLPESMTAVIAVAPGAWHVLWRTDQTRSLDVAQAEAIGKQWTKIVRDQANEEISQINKQRARGSKLTDEEKKEILDRKMRRFLYEEIQANNSFRWFVYDFDLAHTEDQKVFTEVTPGTSQLAQ